MQNLSLYFISPAIAASGGALYKKKALLNILQISQENTCVEVSF